MPRVARKPAEATPPSLGTLRKYGLTVETWREMGKRQGWCCPICTKPFEDRPLAIDHEHVAGFNRRKRRKSKRVIKGKRTDVRVRAMSPAERSVHVRGILHSYCNLFVRSWLTLERASSILEYLKSHEARKRMK